MKIKLLLGWSMKEICGFIFIALTILCGIIAAQEYTANYWLQKGDEFYKNNSYDLALRCYDKAIEISPNNADIWQEKGNILKNLNRIEESESALAKANELNASIMSDASSIFQSESYDSEVTTLSAKELCEIANSIYWEEAFLGLDRDGSRKFDQDRVNETLRTYDKALEIDPKYAEIWCIKGSILEEMKDYVDAIRAYDKCIELDSENSDAWNSKAVTLRLLGRYDDSFRACEKAIKINPDNALAWYNKGRVLELMNRNTESEKALAKACDIDSYYCQFR